MMLRKNVLDNKNPMNSLRLRTLRECFKLINFVSSRTFQWKSEEEAPYINKLKVGMLRFRLE